MKGADDAKANHLPKTFRVHFVRSSASAVLGLGSSCGWVFRAGSNSSALKVLAQAEMEMTSVGELRAL